MPKSERSRGGPGLRSTQAMVEAREHEMIEELSAFIESLQVLLALCADVDKIRPETFREQVDVVRLSFFRLIFWLVWLGGARSYRPV